MILWLMSHACKSILWDRKSTSVDLEHSLLGANMVTTLPLGPFLLNLVHYIFLTTLQNASCVERLYLFVKFVAEGFGHS